jgi:hypothetical protein
MSEWAGSTNSYICADVLLLEKEPVFNGETVYPISTILQFKLRNVNRMPGYVNENNIIITSLLFQDSS